MAIPDFIKETTNKIRHAVIGGEITNTIADGLEKIAGVANDSTDTTKEIEEYIKTVELGWNSDPNKDPEIITARGGETQLKDRFEKTDAQLAHKAPQTAVDNLISGKVDKNGSGQVTWANAAQDFREQITGGNTAVVGDNAVITSNLTNNAVTPPKSTFFSVGKNLFNKETVTAGVHVVFTSGQTSALSGYNASDFIPIYPNRRYIQSTNEQFAFFDQNKAYVSGGTGGPAINSPSNAHFVRVNVRDAFLNTFQLESGDTITPYENYRYALKKDHASADLNTYTVGKVNSDFGLVKQAVAHALSNEPNKKITVEVRPGEYDERFNNIRGFSNVSVIGKNKKDCVLIDRTGDYFRSPIQLSGEFYLKNLTAIANNDDVATLPALTSYAIHIDYNGAGKSLIEDCRFESYQNSAVGIGTRQNQEIVFKDCDIYTDTDFGAALYLHNAVASGTTGQKLVFDNCRILAEKGDFLRVEDSNILYGDGSGTDLEIEFINCHFWSNEKGLNGFSNAPAPANSGMLAGNVKLSPKSHGNNISALNA